MRAEVVVTLACLGGGLVPLAGCARTVVVGSGPIGNADDGGLPPPDWGPADAGLDAGVAQDAEVERDAEVAQRLEPADAILEGDAVGESLSMSDDGSVVASGGEVFRRGDAGWAADGAPGGVWAALSGDGERLVSLDRDGSLLVFRYRDGSWALEERLPPQGEPGCSHPCLAASADGGLLAAAPNSLGSTPLPEGSELLRTFSRDGARDGSSWSEARVVAGPPGISRQGGLPVALSADERTIAVGGGLSNAGWALVDDDLGATELAPPADDDGIFGLSVAVSRDGLVVAVGAPFVWDDGPRRMRAEDAGRDVAGGVFVYRRAAEAWVLEATLRSPQPGAGDGFGHAVALDARGDALIVGAPTEDGGAPVASPAGHVEDSGAAYVFRRLDGRWSAARNLKADRPGAGDRYGTSVAISADGEQWAVGAPERSDGRPGDDGGRGAVYVYR